MPHPRHAALRQEDGDIWRRAGLADDEVDRADVPVGREPGAVAVGVRHRGAERDAAQVGGDPLQPRHAQAEQVAALAGREGMDLVDHDRAQAREHQPAVGVAQQQRQRFRRRQQDVWRLDPLACLAVGWRVPGPRLDRYRQPHLLDRLEQIALDIDRQRLERRNVERVEPLDRRFDQFDQRRQEARQRLARTGGGDQQCVPPGPRAAEHVKLMPAGLPTALLEPAGQGRGKVDQRPDVVCRPQSGEAFTAIPRA